MTMFLVTLIMAKGEWRSRSGESNGEKGMTRLEGMLLAWGDQNGWERFNVVRCDYAIVSGRCG